MYFYIDVYLQGDVHGGHYYAFIRPSSGYAYGGVEANRAEEDGKDDEEDEDSPAAIAPANEGVGKWYRFNDEQVYEVSKMEAVDNCFGRTSTRKGLQFPSSMSSAYMLVYVRKADSPKVCVTASSVVQCSLLHDCSIMRGE